MTGRIAKYLFGIVLLSWSISVHAQFIDKNQDYNFLRKYRKWGFTAGANLYYSNGISPALSVAQMQFRTHLMWGYDLGMAYNIRITNHFGVRLNLLYEKIPVYNLSYYLPAGETTDRDPYKTSLISRRNPFALRLPVALEYRNFLMDRYILFFQAGLDAGYLFGFSDSRAHNPYVSTFFQTNASFKFDPYFAAGWYYEFPWILWQTEIVFRPVISLPYFNGAYASGNYKNASSEAGVLTQKGSYIGLHFTWYLPRPASRVQAACAGSVQSKIVRKRQKAQEKAKRRAEREAEKQRRKIAKKKKRKKKKRFILF